MTTHSLTYTAHCGVCGAKLPAPQLRSRSLCRACLLEAQKPARWHLEPVTLAGLAGAIAFVVMIGAAVLLVWALRSL